MLETEISWITPRSIEQNCAIIVSCAVTDKTCHAAITFTEDCISKITETGYLIYGYAEEGNKIYFKEATKETGYKVSKTRGGMRIQANSAIGKKLLPFVGKYDMRIDQSLGYVFIDKRRMK